MRRSITFVFLMLVCASALDAQERRPHFVYARVGSTSSTYLYYVYDFGTQALGSGTPVISAAIIHDPHAEDSYWEQLLGPGLNVQGRSAGATFLGLVSRASDAWYLEPSLYAWAATRLFEVSGFGAVYVPVEKAGVYQYFLDPASLLVHTTDRLATGISYSLYGGEELPTEQGLGPAVRLGDPAGLTLTAEYFRGLENFEPDWRLTLQVFF